MKKPLALLALPLLLSTLLAALSAPTLAQDQSGKGLASEFVSSDPNTAGGQATIEFAMKYS